MKNIILFLLATLAFSFIFAQNQANKWYFGSLAGLDFSGGAPVALTNGAMNTSEGCASISDAAGNLLFYTDGITVWNANHVAMLNGTGLFGDNISAQAAVIVPKPGSTTLYYVFTMRNWTTGGNGVHYSIVDMTLNGGLGDVTNKNTFINAPAREALSATYHCNGVDIWVIFHENTTSSFHAYLLTAAGLAATPVISTIGSTFQGNNRYGYLRFSHSGTKLCFTLGGDATAPTVELYDFNKTTGAVANPLTLCTLGQFTNAYCSEFSPNDNVLYAVEFNGTQIKQFNLAAGTGAAIIASATNVAVGATASNSAVQLGPDNKIYVCRPSQTSVGAIQNPNVVGVGCNYVNSAVSLGTGSCGLGLPNFFFPLTYTFNTSVNSPICVGDTLFLQATIPAGGSILWQGPANFISGLANNTILNFGLANAGGYNLTVNYAGCTYTQNVVAVADTCAPDHDQDLIPDNVDLDDDNDGIPDLVECGINSTSGQQFTMLNGSFETPIISATTALSIINDNTVPGWETTAPDSLMEFWAFNFNGTPAFQGNQHVELNANFVSTLFQDVSTVPGDSLNWYFAHRGRSGTDVIELKIGTTAVQVSQGTFATGNTAWVVYNGTYVVPAGQTTTRFAYVSVSAAGGNPTVGNFLDGAAFFPVSCHVDSDGDGVPNSWDLDSDNDGIYDLVEAGHAQADANNDGIIDGLPVDFGNNGLFNLIETNDFYYANVTYTIKNTDNLTDYDFLDLDSDEDGCFDVGEIPFSDPNQDGIAGNAPVNVTIDGTVIGCTYPTPNMTNAPLFNFQNPNTTICCTFVLPTTINTSICNGQSYTLPDGTSVNVTGNYVSTLTTAAGCDSIVNTNLLVNNTYSISQVAAICQGQTYTLPNGNVVNATGVYPVTLQAITSCDSVITTAVTVSPTYSQTINAAICQGQNYTLPDGSNANTSGNYIFHYQSINACDSSIQINLTVNPVYAYTVTATLCQGQTYTLPDNSVVNTSGTYTTNLTTIKGCDSIITTQITVYPTFSASVNAEICQGDSYTLQNGTNVVAAGSYPVIFQTIHGCDSIITTNLTVNPTYGSSLNVAICQGDTYTLPNGNVVSIMGTYTNVFQTKKGCDSVINVSLTVNPTYAKTISADICEGINYTLPDGTIATATGSYPILFATANGCDSLITVNLNVHDSPNISIGNDTSMCEGESVTFILANANNFVQYLWSNGNKQKQLTTDKVGAYWVTAKDAYGCIVSDTARVISLYPIPYNFLPKDTVVCDTPNLRLNMTGFAHYRWENGDTLASRLFTETGEYKLTVITNEGCKGSDDFKIGHKCEMQVYCPSAFTPNNSGENDTYFVRGFNVSSFTMSIYDRWGREMITLNSIDDVWDGTYNGKPAPEGVYMYKLRAVSVDNRFLETGGSITLIR